MKMRVRLSGVILFLFLLYAASVNAQLPTPHFGVQLGSSFSSFGSRGSMFSQTLAPSLNWDMNENFHLEVGTIFSFGRMNAAMPDALLAGNMQNLSSTTMYAFGVYRVNPRLSISGATWFEQADLPLFDASMTPHIMQHNPRGMMLGLDYKVTDNLRFGFEVSSSSGLSPWSPGLFRSYGFPGGHLHPMQNIRN